MGDMENKRIMSENIRFFMDKCGKSRKNLCDDLGIKYTTLAGWLSGEKYPRIDKIELMANYFMVPKSRLIEKENGSQNDALAFEMSPHEKKVITAYHNHPDMQSAVDRLLGVDRKADSYPVYNKVFERSYLKVSTPIEPYEIKKPEKSEK